MSEKTATAAGGGTVVGRERLKVFREMTPATQEVARRWGGLLSKGAGVMVRVHYMIGSEIPQILADEAKYGSGAVKQLAEYHNIPGGATTLYKLRNFAQEFTIEFVDEWTSRPMANGRHMEVSHWFEIMKLRDRAAQEKMLERVIKHSLSAKELEREVRSGEAGKTKNARHGGRLPTVPTNPVVGLQKAFDLAQRFNNYEAAAEEAVFGTIKELEPDRITEGLLEKLQQVREEVQEMLDRAKRMVSLIDESAGRVRGVLRAREGNSSRHADNGLGVVATSGKAAPGNCQVEKNGSLDRKKKKKLTRKEAVV
jgi:hypothetical protein